MQRLTFFFLLLCLALPVHAQGTRTKVDRSATGPLLEIVSHIPADAEDLIYLADLEAARSEIDPLTVGQPDDTRRLAPFGAVLMSQGFNTAYLALSAKDPTAALGFSVFEFDQMAGWGSPPDAPVLATRIAGAHARIESSLAAQGLEVREIDNVPVWHVREDYRFDLQARSISPFGGDMGRAQRFALRGDLLLFSPDWPTMNKLLRHGAGRGGETDTQAIVEAAYAFRDAGRLLNVVLVPGQPDRTADLAKVLRLSDDMSAEDRLAALSQLPGGDLPGLPRFLRYGLILWMDGREATGAIAIPFIRRDTAETARDRFEALLATASSAVTEKPYDDLLPPDRRFEIVEADGRHVLILAFTQALSPAFDPDQPINAVTLRQNPMQRLYQMVVRRDIAPLIGFSD